MAFWEQLMKEGQIPSEPGKPALSPAPRSQGHSEQRESLIAAGLTIEGKIEGSGVVRVAGRFKGNVRVDGDLTVEPRAYISGGDSSESCLCQRRSGREHPFLLPCGAHGIRGDNW